jgi:hypothetical protein
MTTFASLYGGFGGVEIERVIFVEQTISVRLGNANKPHYMALGYDIADVTHLVVKVGDLPRGSGVRVGIICPSCRKSRTVAMQEVNLNGHTYCNACVKALSQSKDIAEKRFGRLTAKNPVGKNKQNATLWRCNCDCGKETVVAQYLEWIEKRR